MVCDLTIPKEKYAAFRETCEQVKRDILSVLDELIVVIDKDTEAYNKVSAAFKMPKDTEEQKAARSAAIREATVEATKVPYRTMELCLAGLSITQRASAAAILTPRPIWALPPSICWRDSKARI